VLREAAWLTVLGVSFGLVCAIATAALMGNLLFGVHSWDPATLVAAAGVLGLSALVASYVPARRASRVSPVEALRAE
jgi:ABC-type antimicrobial peptide transport system permease subunit